MGSYLLTPYTLIITTAALLGLLASFLGLFGSLVVFHAGPKGERPEGQWRQRVTGLIIGMAVTAMPILVCWAIFDVSLPMLWEGVTIWRTAELVEDQMVGWMLFAIYIWLVLSPLQFAAGLYAVYRARRHEHVRASQKGIEMSYLS